MPILWGANDGPPPEKMEGNILTTQAGRQLCSFLLCESPVYHHNALQAMQAAVVVWGYQQPTAEWIKEVYAALSKVTHTPLFCTPLFCTPLFCTPLFCTPLF
jgi:hypothetical protein